MRVSRKIYRNKNAHHPRYLGKKRQSKFRKFSLKRGKLRR